MSKDSVATVYTAILNDDGLRQLVAEDPSILDTYELSDEEKAVLVEEASAEVSGFSIGMGPVMSHLSSGPPMSPAGRLVARVRTEPGQRAADRQLEGPGIRGQRRMLPVGLGFRRHG